MRPLLDPRAQAWRLRFLEIARQSEAATAMPAERRLPGLRPRSRMAGFAVVGRARRPAAALRPGP